MDMRKSRLALIASMAIFGTIGILRKHIDLPSSAVALTRAWIGAAFLILLLIIRRQKPDLSGLRAHLLPLLLSGAGLGFNWILLFEAYRYTTVATATLCYYMAPILVILVSPLLFRERLTGRKLICLAAAVIGIVLVSGVADSGLDTDLTGILFGLGAAVLYASVVLMNKKIAGIAAIDRTLLQLLTAGIVLLPYTLLTEDIQSLRPDLTGAVLLLVAGILHTGIAYALYFGAIPSLSAQTAALYSYIDPILAIVLSAVALREPVTAAGLAGAVLILGAAFLSERE